MPIYGQAPLTVAFTDTSGGVVTSWLWSFGDGDTATDQNPIHTYSFDGTYTVVLTVTSAQGTATISDFVVVGPVVAPWTPPANPSIGTPGADPQVMLRLSNDGGKTWGTEMMRSAGKTGEYFKRVRWLRMGSARRRVFEAAVSDPIPWRITGAYLAGKDGPGA